ncbi:MAG: nucleotidyl transferase AbiEii/AbiGii toxin family protein [Candidatus Moranbacteria bacterium]|jgi:predicted nucleotidyltransferase component of viral defense system|nr:nucleotidyl transferase AbiEii/AbiGii toxin family protein [Candidatus Moranbacteria bacterium]
MIINKEEHKKIMLNILADISSDPILSVNLGFKGGTCVYFLYGLNRFSVDLDFDLLDFSKKEIVIGKMDALLEKYGTLKKDGTLRRKIKYSEESVALKVDISDRAEINKLNKYEVKDIVSGVPLQVLVQGDIFAHKLAAVTDRYNSKTKNKAIANRDLYDINFFFDQGWKFNEEIIEVRSQMKAGEYLNVLKDFVEKKVDEKNILDGIGALIDDKERLWVRNNLKKELIRKLAIQIMAMK